MAARDPPDSSRGRPSRARPDRAAPVRVIAQRTLPFTIITAVVNGMLNLPSMLSLGRRFELERFRQQLRSAGAADDGDRVDVFGRDAMLFAKRQRRGIRRARVTARGPDLEAVHVEQRKSAAEAADDRIPVGLARAHVGLEKSVAAFDIPSSRRCRAAQARPRATAPCPEKPACIERMCVAAPTAIWRLPLNW